jgi:recombination protein RecR
MAADPIQRLVRELARLPGIGEKSATRLAMHLVRSPKPQVRELAQALIDATEQIGLCSVCMTLTAEDPCRLCADARRDHDVVCVVAQPSDVIAIERGCHYRGRYHVLHGVLAPLDGVGPDDLRIAELVRRLAPAGGAPVQELIVATAPTVEGEATAMYLARLIKPLGVRVTRIATGLPVGGDLEYSDQATIGRALAGRTAL